MKKWFTLGAGLLFSALILEAQNTNVTTPTTPGGTTNTVPKFNGQYSLTNSFITENGVFVGINAPSQLGGEFFSIQKSTNSYVMSRIYNSNNLGLANAGYTATIGSNYSISMTMLSSNYGTSGMYGPDLGILTTNGPGGMNIGCTSTSANNQVSFWTSNTRRMVITNSGLVGIGTSSPSSQLEVNQVGGSSLRIYANSFGDIASTVSLRPHFGTGTDFSIYEGTTITASDVLRFQIANSGAVSINSSMSTSSSNSPLTIKNTSITSNPNNTTYYNTLFEVKANGQTYIGTQRNTAQPNAMLTVNGDLVVGTNSAANIYVTQNTWSDFVFDEDYQLMGLYELENFYKVNHHLPGVPTTIDIQRDGNNLGQTDAILLQKIEELVLYVVEQQKKIDRLEKKLNEKE